MTPDFFAQSMRAPNFGPSFRRIDRHGSLG
jgi:hypothetical protein